MSAEPNGIKNVSQWKQNMDDRAHNSRRRLAGYVLTILMAIMSLGVWAQDTRERPVDENNLKVVFVYNFAKYTQWPAPSPPSEAQDFLICVLGHINFSRQLTEIDGASLDRERITVNYLNNLSDVRQCRILILGVLEKQMLKTALDAVGSLAVLTISDLPEFINAGGMIEMFRDNTRLRFKINHERMIARGIVLSSKVLRLATIIPDPVKGEQNGCCEQKKESK